VSAGINEPEESLLGARIDDELSFIASLPPERQLTMLKSLVTMVYLALDDHAEVPRHLHPSDIVDKYLQRGNILKDGDW